MPSAILTYHSVDTSGSVISTSPSVFASHMKVLSELKVEVLPLSRIQNTNGCVAITFDDGFQNLEEHAFPLLARYGLPATVFLVTGHCGGYNDWPSQPQATPRLPLLSWTAAKGLDGPLIEWGAHTVTHPDLTKLPEAAATQEIRESRDAIEQHLGTAAASFCYPYGATNEAIESLVGDVFQNACGTRLRLLRGGESAMELPRIDSYYLRDPAWLKRLLGPSGRSYIGVRRAMRETRQWLSR